MGMGYEGGALYIEQSRNRVVEANRDNYACTGVELMTIGDIAGADAGIGDKNWPLVVKCRT